MKLSDRDLRVFSVVEKDSSLSVSRIASILRLKPHVVRDIIKKYEDLGVIREKYEIDFGRIDLQEVKVYFSLTDKARPEKDAIYNWLLEREDVLKVTVVSGEFDFIAKFLKISMAAINISLSELSAEFGDVFQLKIITAPVGRKVLSRKYLSSTTEREVLSFQKKGSIYLDELDEVILNAVLRDGSLKRRELVAITGAKEKTLSWRIQELKKKGVIRARRYEIDTRVLGRFTCIALVSLKTQEASFRKEFEAYLEKEAEVTEVSETLSFWDYEVRMECLSPESQMNFTDSLYRNFPSKIARVRSLNVVKASAGKNISIDTYKATIEFEAA